MSWDVFLGLCFFLLMFLGVGTLVVWHVRQNIRSSKLAEIEKGKPWYATVTKTETKDLIVNKTRRALLTVHYRLDDGTRGHVQAYDGDGLKWAYVGALARYKHGPSFKELQTWHVGDRLFKAAGEDFPSKA